MNQLYMDCDTLVTSIWFIESLITFFHGLEVIHVVLVNSMSYYLGYLLCKLFT